MFKRGLVREYSSLLSFGFRVLDLLLIFGGGYLAYYARFGNLKLPSNYELVLTIGVLLSVLLLPRFNLYQSWRGKGLIQQLWMITLAWGAIVLVLVVLGFGTKTGEDYSRIWAGVWMIIAWGLLIGSRILTRVVFNAFRRQGWNHRHIVIVGAGVLGRNVAEQIKEAEWVGYDLVAYWDDNQAIQGRSFDHVPVLSPEQGVGLLESGKQHVDEVWLALPLRAQDRMREILSMMRHCTLKIRLVPDIFGFHLLNHSMSEVAGIPVLDINASPMEGMNRVIKAIEDRVLALVILILVSPLLLAIAIGVKMSSPGPVLFKQKRHGWDGKPINVYKFRTMVVHQDVEGQVTQASKNDKRITPVGAFLRRTSLDELPQFYNVLQGRMSIVGPRPHAMAHNELYKNQVDAYMQRHMVKPGITGWAQINGWRGETDTLDKMQRRVEYDLYYIENWSLWFDLKIIFLTIFKGFVHKNAY